MNSWMWRDSVLFGFVGRLIVADYVSDGTLNDTTRRPVTEPREISLPDSGRAAYVPSLIKDTRNSPVCAVIKGLIFCSAMADY